MSDENNDHLRPRAGRSIAEKLSLQEPVKCYDRTLDALEFERPRAKHLRTVQQYEDDPYTQIAELIVSLADVPMETVDRLSIDDFKRAERMIQGFFGLKTPEKSA